MSCRISSISKSWLKQSLIGLGSANIVNGAGLILGCRDVEQFWTIISWQLVSLASKYFIQPSMVVVTFQNASVFYGCILKAVERVHNNVSVIFGVVIPEINIPALHGIITVIFFIHCCGTSILNNFSWYFSSFLCG